ncbi:MAG: EAL domain-containing protein [Burkholderiaceae bacterium]|nr:EAL domain-containing protein [Burkholderiaceae bacterium]
MAEHASGTSARRVTAAQLLHCARTGLQGSNRAAFLVVALNRSDRLAALAQSVSARLMLSQISARIESVLRAEDRYAIASHDEVWVLLSGAASAGHAELAGGTLRAGLSRAYQVELAQQGQARMFCRPVIGGLSFVAAECPPELDLVAAATDACLRAACTDSQVQIDVARGKAARLDRARIEVELRAALKGNALEVHLQPQIDLIDGGCVGAEALVRWPHPEGGMIDPALIAEIAEQRGMIGDLTQFVLNTVLRHLMSWSALEIAPKVSINLSSVTLSDPTYPSFIRDALDTWGVAPDRLTFELTEGLIVRDETSAQHFMRELRDLGCRIALDDFGIGYTSFAYLRQFPLDELKIDQSFVRGVGTDRASRRIVQAQIDVAHAFELRALAEGVEDAQVVNWLRNARCDSAQGYHYARAMHPDAFLGWYRAFNRQDEAQPALVTR